MDIRTSLQIVNQLNESSRAYLYHGTSFYNALQILRSEEFQASDKRIEGDDDYHNISLTRDPRLRYYSVDGEDMNGHAPIVFVIDQVALSANFRTRPFDFNGTGSRASGESEEQAVTLIVPIDRCVVAIRLYSVPTGFAPNMDDLYQMGFDEETTDAKFKRKGPAAMSELYDRICQEADARGIQVQDLRRKSPRTVMRHHVQGNIDQMKNGATGGLSGRNYR